MPGQFPATYVVFDILEKDGISLIDRPLRERREILASSLEEGAHVTVSVPVEEKGRDYYAVVTGAGLEGIMAKRLDSVYEPGQRSSSWLKIKELRTCDCVIFGYTEGTGARAGTFGALILGLYEQGIRRSTWERSGQVSLMISSGLSWQNSGPSYRQGRPCTECRKVRGSHGSCPRLVCEVAYQSVTRDRQAQDAEVHPDSPGQNTGGMHHRAARDGPSRAGRQIRDERNNRERRKSRERDRRGTQKERGRAREGPKESGRLPGRERKEG